MNWDDLKFVLAAAEAGSVNGAARRLGVNHATALRRIAHLETTLDLRIFDRTTNGYVVTRDGNYVVSAAQKIRDEVHALERQLAGKSDLMEGSIRVTTTDSLMVSVVGPALRSFQDRHPSITLELVMTNALVDLDRSQVDVAIRPTRTPPEGLRSQRPSGLGFGLYASADFLRRHPNAPDARSPWLVMDSSQLTSPTQYWMRTHYPGAIERVRAGSFVTLTELAEQGQGLAILPCCLGGRSSTLVRIGELLADIETGIWVMVPAHLAGAERIEAFCEHMMRSLGAQTGLLEGRETSR